MTERRRQDGICYAGWRWGVLGGLGLFCFGLAGCGLFDGEADKLEKLLGRVSCSDTMAAEYSAAVGDTLGLGKKGLLYRLRHKRSPRLNPAARVFWEELTISADFAQLDVSSMETDQVGTCTIVSVFCRPGNDTEGRNYCVSKRVTGPNLDNTRYEERVDFFVSDSNDVGEFREQLRSILEKRSS